MGAEIQADPLHSRIFPERKCAVGGSECKGRVIVYGPATMCECHVLMWEDAEQAGKVDRMRAWVRQARTARSAS